MWGRAEGSRRVTAIAVDPLPAGRRQRGTRVRLPKVNRRQRGTSTDSPKLIVSESEKVKSESEKVKSEKVKKVKKVKSE